MSTRLQFVNANLNIRTLKLAVSANSGVHIGGDYKFMTKSELINFLAGCDADRLAVMRSHLLSLINKSLGLTSGTNRPAMARSLHNFLSPLHTPAAVDVVVTSDLHQAHADIAAVFGDSPVAADLHKLVNA